MRSAQQVVPPSSEDALDRKAGLYDALHSYTATQLHSYTATQLHIMLEEAGLRGTPRDAMLTDDDSAGSVASFSVRYLDFEPQKKQEG